MKINNMVDLLKFLKIDNIEEFNLNINKIAVVNNKMLFVFEGEHILSYDKISLLNNSLNKEFKGVEVNTRYIYVKSNKDLEIDYLKNIIKDLSVKRGRLTFLQDAKIEHEGNLLIYVTSSLLETLNRELDLIGKHLNHYGINTRVLGKNLISGSGLTEIIEDDVLVKMDRKLNEQIVVQKQETTTKIEEPKNNFKQKVIFKGVETSIAKIPKTKMDLDRYRQEEGLPNFIIEGQVFNVEAKDIRNDGRIYTISITDYTESIVVKFFGYNQNRAIYDEMFKVKDWFRISGKVDYDVYARDINMVGDKVTQIEPKRRDIKRRDDFPRKRVELHLHTKMSTQDGIADIKEYVELAEGFGHTALALTDHHALYAIPDFYNATKNKNIKPIYGVEVNEIRNSDSDITLTNHSVELNLETTYVVFDVETTGFSTTFDEIIEIAAVKLRGGKVVDEYSTFVKPEEAIITEKITEITSITEEDVKDSPGIKEVMEKFRDFAEGSILVAHNASFDMSHIYANYKKLGIEEEYPVFDTLQYMRVVYKDEMKRFNLKAMCQKFKVSLEQHHRAIFDTKATADCFLHIIASIKNKGIVNFNEINSLKKETPYKHNFANHLNILVKNEIGLKNLFKIVSSAHTTDYGKEPIVLRDNLDRLREGLLVGSGCVNGRVFEAAMNLSQQELEKEIEYFDYIEVQPPSVYSHLFEEHTIDVRKRRIEEIIIKIITTARSKGKIVVATGDVHHIDDNDKVYRDILTKTPITGGGMHKLSRVKDIPSQFFMSTTEMIKEFEFIGSKLAEEIVIDNTNLIADKVERVQAIKDELFTPTDDFLKDEGILSIEKKLTDMCHERANYLYGDNLPQIVMDRMDKELKSIIDNGFAVIYYISHMLVKKSNDEGYLVGSRGSVGSSFVETLTGITEVNPMSPHYRCPKCKFSAFKMNDEEKSNYKVTLEEEKVQIVLDKYDSGFDLPDLECPLCKEEMKKDGHDIPFETFLGFKGDKVPDIDLNFSGEYQSVAHDYCKEVFGEEYAFRAGTIGTIADKTAFGFVKAYYEKQGVVTSNVEAARLAKKITGVKRTTGQHPGGIIIVPNYMDIYDITPIQYPSDDINNEWRTTHFDFHSIHDNLLKLDILGHDDPTVIKYLMDYVKANPDEFEFSESKDIPVDCKDVYKLFVGTDVIGVKPADLNSKIASFGVPEFGTSFVRQMLEDTKPSSFSELVKISGLSHGTDVWINNAKDLVTGSHQKFDKVEFKEIIGCRDDIMVYLMYQGLDPQDAFTIMEFVRKGKPTIDTKKWQEYIDIMVEHNVPEWYIWSCQQIKYMFPKAHATAYVLMAIRVAWFKVHKPLLYYQAYLSKRASQFGAFEMLEGPKAIKKRMYEISSKGYSVTATEKALMTVLEIALEFCLRGFKFSKIDINKSLATEFAMIDDKTLMLPFISLDGLGGNVAEGIIEARKEGLFSSIKDVKKRTKLNKTQLAYLEKMNSFESFIEEKEDIFSMDNKKEKEKVEESNLFNL